MPKIEYFDCCFYTDNKNVFAFPTATHEYQIFLVILQMQRASHNPCKCKLMVQNRFGSPAFTLKLKILVTANSCQSVLNCLLSGLFSTVNKQMKPHEVSD